MNFTKKSKRGLTKEVFKKEYLLISSPLTTVAQQFLRQFWRAAEKNLKPHLVIISFQSHQYLPKLAIGAVNRPCNFFNLKILNLQ